METRLKQLEAELEASRRELQAAHEKQRAGDDVFRRFSDSGILGIAVFELSGKIVLANEALLGMVGSPAEEVTSGKLRWDQLTPPEWKSRTAEALEELKTSGSCAPYEGEYVRRDGTRFWGLFTGVMMAGQNAVAFLFDITTRKKTEEALKTSENRFRTMFDQSPLSVQVFAPDGSHRAANPAWQKLWDTTPDQLTGYNILQDPQAKAKGSMEYIERAFKGESVAVPPMLYDPAEIGRKGRPRWIESYLYPVKDDGAIREVVLLLHDVSERMEAEQERNRVLASEREERARVEEAQRRLGFLAEASRILASSLDYQTTLDQVAHLAVPILADWCDIRVLDETGAIRRVAITHSDPEKIAHADELDRRYPVSPDDPRGAAHVLRTGQAEIYREIPDELLVAGARDEEHLRISRELGLKSALVMPLTARGRTLGVITLIYAESGRGYGDEEIALAEDLARRAGTAIDNARLYTEAESAVRLHQTVEQKLTLLTEATSTLIGSLNLDQVLVEILALSRRLMKADSYAIWRLDRTARRWTIAAAEGLSQQYRSTVVDALQHSIAMPSTPMIVGDITEEPLLATHRSLLEKEGVRSMLVLPLPMHAAISGTLVFYYRELHRFDDIELKVSTALANLAASAIATTELYEAAHQRADQLAEADRQKDQFLGMLAHELRNPLSAISNAVQVARRAPAGTGALQRAREVIERQSQHMARLVDELLDVSRISRGKIELHPQRLDLAELVHRTCEDHRHILEGAGISLTVERSDVPLWIDGDPTRLRQTLGNLLQNAAKYTNPGGQVTVRAGVAPERNTAKVEVADTGIGIAPELLSRLFDPFVQADRSLDRSQGGLGLGLALVKGITELHGGRAHARSEGVGRGATFAFEIPLQSPAAQECELATPTAIGAGTLRVLIIEDNADAAETLRDLLELFGHQVEVAHSGPSGVEMARRVRPDLVLCDLGLPGMDGYAVAAALRRDPATTASRLIVVTGYGREEDIRRSAEAGFHAHLTKPVEVESLQRVLAESLAPGRRVD